MSITSCTQYLMTSSRSGLSRKILYVPPNSGLKRRPTSVLVLSQSAVQGRSLEMHFANPLTYSAPYRYRFAHSRPWGSMIPATFTPKWANSASESFRMSKKTLKMLLDSQMDRRPVLDSVEGSNACDPRTWTSTRYTVGSGGTRSCTMAMLPVLPRLASFCAA